MRRIILIAFLSFLGFYTYSLFSAPGFPVLQAGFYQGRIHNQAKTLYHLYLSVAQDQRASGLLLNSDKSWEITPSNVGRLPTEAGPLLISLPDDLTFHLVGEVSEQGRILGEVENMEASFELVRSGVSAQLAESPVDLRSLSYLQDLYLSSHNEQESLQEKTKTLEVDVDNLEQIVTNPDKLKNLAEHKLQELYEQLDAMHNPTLEYEKQLLEQQKPLATLVQLLPQGKLVELNRLLLELEAKEYNNLATIPTFTSDSFNDLIGSYLEQTTHESLRSQIAREKDLIYILEYKRRRMQ